MRPPLASRLTCFARRFAREEGGALTIEAVLWIPFFFVILMLITDASLAFFSKAQAIRAIQNGNRAFAIDDEADPIVTQEEIRLEFADLAPNAVATTTIDSVDDTVSTTLEYPARDVVLFNTLDVLGGWEITVRAMQYVERDL